MLPVLQPAQLGRELAACTALGTAIGAVRAFFPVRGRSALCRMPAHRAVLFGVQSYAAALSSAGVLRWYMVLALCRSPLHGRPCWAFRCGGPGGVWRGCWVLRCALPGNGCCGRWLCGTQRAAQHAKNAGTQKEPQKIRKRTCQTSAVCCIIQTYQSKRRDAVCLLRRWGRVQWQIRAAKRAGSVRLAKR